MIMKHSSHQTLRSSVVLVLAVVGCNDEDLRDLGYTLSEQNQAEPEPVVEPSFDCEKPLPTELVTADAITRIVAADVAAAASEDRPFLRYASVGNAINADRCAIAVNGARQALSKLLNGVSREPSLALPTAVGQDEVPIVFRFDLRDYGLAREIALGDETHADGWEALLASSPYAVELGGEDGVFLARETGTASAWLSIDAIVQAASDAHVYYALANIPPTLAELREQVGLPGELDPFRDGLPRAATSRSRVLRARGDMRAIDRYDIDAGTYYEALQIETTELLADPLHVQPEAQRLILFNLPNGLSAFAIMDAAGNRRETAELLLDTNLRDFQGRVLISCSNCHAQGLIPMDDELLPAIVDNADLFASDVVDAYSNGPSAEQRFELFQADGQRHLDGLEGAGLDARGGDPIATLFFDIDQELDSIYGAADLLVSPETLRARLAELPPALLPLGVGLRVSREQFGAAYAAAFCTLHTGDENPPSNCD
jgi:hypothetical protein